MKRKCVLIISIILLNYFMMQVTAQTVPTRENAIETFLVEPVEMEKNHVWVLADKVGPTINWSCQPKSDCLYTNSLVSEVDHQKGQKCPEALAASLAEYVSQDYKEALPLTVFNGWQWEYSFDLSQYEAASYTLTARGGAWESAWESVLCSTHAAQSGHWETVGGQTEDHNTENEGQYLSTINVKTYEDTRLRNGYPNERQLAR